MKKLLLLLLVVTVIISLGTVAFAEPGPTLTLRVLVSPTGNVRYEAQIIPFTAQPLKIDFYTELITGSIPVFPTKYVGSALTDHYGVATFIFHQDTGKYLGGAKYVSPTGTELCSNVVQYTIQ